MKEAEKTGQLDKNSASKYNKKSVGRLFFSEEEEGNFTIDHRRIIMIFFLWSVLPANN